MAMTPESIPGKKDDSPSSGNQKKLPEQGLRCPRCDSPNTKFCYHNNYNLSQPRHFCKTCRRYWTKGGALRNVPIGGGCRKNKKTRSSSRSLGNNNSYNSSESTSELGDFKFFQDISPTMDFHHGGVSNFPKLYSPQFSSYNSIPSNTNPCFGLETLGGSISSPVMGFSFPLPDVMKQGESSGCGLEQVEDQMDNPMNVHSNFPSSIESLSSINQELHWKLQQQRLGLFFAVGENNQNENPCTSFPMEIINVRKPQPIIFRNLDIAKPPSFVLDGSSKKECGGDRNISTEWFFETSYAPSNNQNPTNNSSNGNEGTSDWRGNQGWSDLNQYGALP